MSVSNLAFVYRTAQANLRQMLPDFRFHLKKKKQNRVTICYLNVLYFIVLKIITIINKLLEAPRFPTYHRISSQNLKQKSGYTLLLMLKRVSCS